MSGKEGDDFLDGDESDGGQTDTDSYNDHDRRQAENDGDDQKATNAAGSFVGDRNEDDKEYFNLPASLSSARHFKGITKNKKAGEVEITVRLPARWAEGGRGVVSIVSRDGWAWR